MQRNADPEVIGPMRAVLRAHDFQALVFGCVGEASRDVHKLIGTLARAGVKAAAVRRGCGRATDSLLGTLAWHRRRTLGCAVSRSLADMLLDRLSVLDPLHTAQDGDRDGSCWRGAGADTNGRRAGDAAARRRAAESGHRDAF